LFARSEYAVCKVEYRSRVDESKAAKLLHSSCDAVSMS
jgi:hypothetical protein